MAAWGLTRMGAAALAVVLIPAAGLAQEDDSPFPPGATLGGGYGGFERGQLFERADTDGDGAVTLDEHMANAELMFGRLDANGDGQYDAAELQSLAPQGQEMSGRRAQFAGRFAERAVSRSDANGDGVVTFAEHMAQSEEGFARLDANADGRITQEELPEPDPNRRGRFMGRGGGSQ